MSDASYKYYFLNPDRSLSTLRDDVAGILHARIGVQPADRWNSIPNASDWKNSPESNPARKKVVIVGNIFQAKSLPAGDEDGAADPIVKLYHHGSQAKTNISFKTLNPVWNSRIPFSTYTLGSEIPPIIIQVFDYDESFVGVVDYEFLGATLTFLSKDNFSKDPNYIPQPKWMDLYYSKGIKMGKILASFTIHEFENDFVKKLTPIVVPKTKHLVKISILGLRGLQSTGALPVTKPRIKINTSSLFEDSERSEGVAFSNFTSIAKESGPNPNMGSVMNLELNLPKDERLMPILSCQVEDKVFFGIKDNILGNFQIDLGKFAVLYKIELISKLKLIGNELKTKSKRNDLLDTLKLLTAKFEREVMEQAEYVEVDYEKAKRVKAEEAKELLAKFQEPDNLKKLDNLNNLVNKDEEKVDLRDAHKDKDFKPIDQSKITSRGNLENLLPDKNESKKKELGMKIDQQIGENETEVKKAVESIIEEESNPLLSREVKDTKIKKSLLFKSNFEHSTDTIVVMPTYKKVKLANGIETVENTFENKRDYLELGFNSKQKKTKHYRLCLDGPLESSHFTGKSVFQKIPIYRGKRIKDQSSWIAKIFSSSESYHEVGSFKGMISIMPEEIIQNLQRMNIERELQELDIPSSVKNWTKSEIDRDIMEDVTIIIRVYIIDAIIYDSLGIDTFGEPDPFIKLVLGSEVISDRENTIDNKNNPKFYKRFE